MHLKGCVLYSVIYMCVIQRGNSFDFKYDRGNGDLIVLSLVGMRRCALFGDPSDVLIEVMLLVVINFSSWC